MAEKISNQFTGLDMHSLIAGPLIAACEAETMLAAATAKFIEDVGLEEPADSKEGGNKVRKIRTTEFSFDRTVRGADGENIGQETVVMSVPMLSVVKIPIIGSDEMNISFDMEIKFSETNESSEDKKSGAEGNNSLDIGPFKAKVNVKGAIICHEKNAVSSDNAAKYHVELQAKDGTTPEGLAKMMDILTSPGTQKNIRHIPEKAE